MTLCDLHHNITEMVCEIQKLQITNRKWYRPFAYRIVAIPMSLSDLQMYSCAAVETFLSDCTLRGPSAIAEPRVLIGRCQPWHMCGAVTMDMAAVLWLTAT